MPVFIYRGKKSDGEEVKGEREAVNRFDLARFMRQEGVTLISADEAVRRGTTSLRERIATMGTVSIKQKIIFASNLSAMIGAGLSLARALHVLQRQTKKGKFTKVLGSLIDDTNRGLSLTAAFERFPDVFPPEFIAMTHAGEETGRLPESLTSLAEQLTKRYELRKKIRGALIYPSIVITVVMIVGYLMLVLLIPTLAETFESLGAELPFTTRMVIGVSGFLRAHTLPVILAFFVLLGSSVKFLRMPLGKRALSFTLLRLPLTRTITQNANAALTMRTLSSMVSSGVDMLKALAITQDVLQNPYYQTVLKEAGDQIEKGKALSEVFERRGDLYPILVTELIEVGEETGKLSEMLLRGATFYEGEVESMTKNLSTVIEPVLMVFIGVAVGFFAVSMIQPIYSIGDYIQ